MPAGVERGAELPVPVGAEPQVALTASLWFWASEVAGAVVGTEVQALSYATRAVLDCFGTEAAGTEYSMHLSAPSTTPKTKDWQEPLASH